MVVAIVVMALMAGGCSFLSAKVPTVGIVADGRLVQVDCPRGSSVEKILSAAGVELYSGDYVKPDLNSIAEAGSMIVVDRAVPVLILVDGTKTEMKSRGTYVRDAVEESGAGSSPSDLITPAPDVELSEGMSIAIARVSEETVSKQVSVPFKVEHHEDTTLELGISKVVQKGQQGLKEVVTCLSKLDGKVVSTKTVSERIVKQPVTQIVAVGTIGVVSRGGHTIRFKKAFESVATAYTPGPESTGASADGYTATGLRAGFGIVAVDPRVIPLGSRLYVDGYGFAVAGDTGGAIKGMRIDVCFESVSEAIRWGRKKVKVYVLA